jgi:hypothetical protein
MRHSMAGAHVSTSLSGNTGTIGAILTVAVLYSVMSAAWGREAAKCGANRTSNSGSASAFQLPLHFLYTSLRLNTV